MVESESTGSIRLVEVNAVVSLTRETVCSNSKFENTPGVLLITSSHPGHFGKKGIRVFREHINRDWCKSVNVDKLWTLLSEASRKQFLENKSKLAPVIDVTKSGFQKVTGRGRLPNHPIVIKARFFSEKAQRRIQAVGGSCVLVA